MRYKASLPVGLGKRPFKIIYYTGGKKVGRVTSCGSPEGVVRSATVRVVSGHAKIAMVELGGVPFCHVTDSDNSLKLVFV